MKKIKTGLTLFFVLVSVLVFAQSINSPYSRYGLGELHGRNVNTTLTGMGGISIGYWNHSKINPGNPASYAEFDSLAFLFEVGIVGDIVNHKTVLQSENSNYLTLSYILTGFPVTRWWRTSLGVLPFSKIGYDVNINVDLGDYTTRIINSIKGDGGLNQFYWGNGFKIGKHLRVGFDGIYIFGRGSRSSLVYFPDSLNVFGTKTKNNVIGSDFIFDYGIQYDIPINQNRILTIGAIYSNSWSMRAKRTTVSYTLSGGFDDIVESIKDTIIYKPEEKGRIVIPNRFGLGLMYKNSDYWLVGADFEWQQWEKFAAFGATDSLDNAWRFSIGGEIIPKHTSISNLLKRMTYRLGFRYVNSYLSLLGKPINEYGISFGLTFPMKKSKTKIDLGIEAGSRGTTDNNLIKENFVNFTFGVSISEGWFFKRKYR